LSGRFLRRWTVPRRPTVHVQRLRRTCCKYSNLVLPWVSLIFHPTRTGHGRCGLHALDSGKECGGLRRASCFTTQPQLWKPLWASADRGAAAGLVPVRIEPASTSDCGLVSEARESLIAKLAPCAVHKHAAESASHTHGLASFDQNELPNF